MGEHGSESVIAEAAQGLGDIWGGGEATRWSVPRAVGVAGNSLFFSSALHFFMSPPPLLLH